MEGDWNTIAVVDIKGGPAKTTTAFHLAAFRALEGKTVVIDGDAKQGSGLKWREWSERFVGPGALPFDVVTWEELDGEWVYFVIDTPPADDGIARAALTKADVVVVPVSPTLMDVAQLPDTRALIAEAQMVNPALRDFYLLTKVRAGTQEATEVREAVAELVGERLLKAEVPLWQSVARTFGRLPDLLGPYAGVWEELKGRME